MCQMLGHRLHNTLLFPCLSPSQSELLGKDLLFLVSGTPIPSSGTDPDRGTDAETLLHPGGGASCDHLWSSSGHSLAPDIEEALNGGRYGACLQRAFKVVLGLNSPVIQSMADAPCCRHRSLPASLSFSESRCAKTEHKGPCRCLCAGCTCEAPYAL